MNVLLNLPRVELFAFIAVIFGSFAAIIYVIAIWRGHRPPYTTMIVWQVLGLSLWYFHKQTDATWSLALIELYAIVPVIYLIELVVLRAKWSMQTRDFTCLGFAALSWCLWLLTKDIDSSLNMAVLFPLVALVCTDAFGSWPIFQDAWQGREYNGRYAWLCTLIAVSCELGTVNDYWSYEIILPLYFLGMMGGTALFALFRHPHTEKVVRAKYRPAPMARRMQSVDRPLRRRVLPGQ